MKSFVSVKLSEGVKLQLEKVRDDLGCFTLQETIGALILCFYRQNEKPKKQAKPKKEPKPRVEAESNLSVVVKEKEPNEVWQVWESYREAYFARYGTEAIHNAKQMKHCKDLIGRLGLDLAIDVAAFYLTVNDQWQLQKGHALEYLVKDCEAFARRMKNDIRTIGFEKTRQVERLSEWDQILKKIEREKQKKTTKENK